MLISWNNKPLGEISETSSLLDMQTNCPNFFHQKFGTRETYNVYRGQLIVRHTVKIHNHALFLVNQRHTVVYLYLPKGFVSDPGRPDTMCVATYYSNALRKAKKLIDHVLGTQKME